MDNQAKFILVPKGKDYNLLAIDDIVYISAEYDGSFLYDQMNSKYYTTKKLKDFESVLPTDTFKRIHHSYLISMKHIVKILRNDDLQVETSIGEVLPISRRKKQDFLNNFLKI